MRADQVRVVDVGVVDVAICLHLRLNRLHDLAFTEILMVHLDTGDLLEGLGQDRRLVVVRRERPSESTLIS